MRKNIKFILVFVVLVLCTLDTNSWSFLSWSNEGEQRHNSVQGSDFGSSNSIPSNLNINLNVSNGSSHNENNNWFVLVDVGKLSSFTKSLYGDGQVYYKSLSHYILSNKKKIFFQGLIGGYASINGLFWYWKAMLNNLNSWNMWQRSYSNQELYQMSSNKLGAMLIKDIQLMYIDIQNPTDFATPLTKFLYNIDKEYKYLNYYKYLVDTINKFYIKRFFFYDKDFYASIQSKIERLTFIKYSFLGWLTDIKVQSTFPSALQKQITRFIKKSSPMLKSLDASFNVDTKENTSTLRV